MVLRPLTFSQLARAVGVSVEELESYRSMGLLQPPRRRRSREADLGFHQEHLDRVRFVRRALDAGYSLQAIGRLLESNTLLTCSDVYRITMAEIERQRLAGDESTELTKLAAKCPRVGSRNDCTILTTLRQDDGRP